MDTPFGALILQARYRAIATHYQNGGQPLLGVERVPVGPTSATVPPPAFTSAGDIRTDHQVISTAPYSEATQRPDQQQRDTIPHISPIGANSPHSAPAAHGTAARTFRDYFSSTAGRPTAPPSRVPSYYAHTPRNSVVPSPVNQGLPDEGWDYITTPAGSPPPPEIGHQ